jgi:hypothetical protein
VYACHNRVCNAMKLQLNESCLCAGRKTPSFKILKIKTCSLSLNQPSCAPVYDYISIDRCRYFRHVAVAVAVWTSSKRKRTRRYRRLVLTEWGEAGHCKCELWSSCLTHIYSIVPLSNLCPTGCRRFYTYCKHSFSLYSYSPLFYWNYDAPFFLQPSSHNLRPLSPV